MLWKCHFFCHVMWCHVMSCDDVLCRVVSCCVVSCCVVSCLVMSCHGTIIITIIITITCAEGKESGLCRQVVFIVAEMARNGLCSKVLTVFDRHTGKQASRLVEVSPFSALPITCLKYPLACVIWCCVSQPSIQSQQ